MRFAESVSGLLEHAGALTRLGMLAALVIGVVLDPGHARRQAATDAVARWIPASAATAARASTTPLHAAPAAAAPTPERPTAESASAAKAACAQGTRGAVAPALATMELRYAFVVVHDQALVLSHATVREALASAGTERMRASVAAQVHDALARAARLEAETVKAARIRPVG